MLQGFGKDPAPTNRKTSTSSLRTTGSPASPRTAPHHLPESPAPSKPMTQPSCPVSGKTMPAPTPPTPSTTAIALAVYGSSTASPKSELSQTIPIVPSPTARLTTRAPRLVHVYLLPAKPLTASASTTPRRSPPTSEARLHGDLNRLKELDFVFVNLYVRLPYTWAEQGIQFAHLQM